MRASRASRPAMFTKNLIFHEYTSWPSRVMCHPHENTRRAPGSARSRAPPGPFPMSSDGLSSVQHGEHAGVPAPWPLPPGRRGTGR